MKWLWDIDKTYKFKYILANIMLVFFDTIGFIIPIIIGVLVDKITVYNDLDGFLATSLFLLAFILFKYIGAYFSVIRLDLIGFKITSNLKKVCYQKINTLDYYFYEHTSLGELMINFTTDIAHIRKHINYNIKTIAALVCTFICSLVYLLTINVPFTLALLTPGVIIGIISYKFMKKIGPFYEDARNLNEKTNSFISDNIEGNKVVKSFALESSEVEKFKFKNTKWIDKETECVLMENRFFAKVTFLSYLMVAILLLVGGYLFINNKITMGELIVFNAYLYNLRAPFERISWLLSRIKRYTISKERLVNLLNSSVKVKLPGTKKLESMLVPIEFRGVDIVYDEKVVVSNLNIKIEPYETVAFIGKTGSGKSSIVKLLLGFVTPSKGELLINNENYLNYDIKCIRDRVGYVTQNAFLFSDTIYNNISYGNEEITKEEAKYFGDIASCTYIDKLPEGIETIIGEKGVGLSGGEKQRLSLARALAVKPDILLLDDITSALDIETEMKINKSIEDLEYKSTKIIIASKIVSVMNADKIYVLDKGCVIDAGTHDELMAKKGYYYELYKLEEGSINGSQ